MHMKPTLRTSIFMVSLLASSNVLAEESSAVPAVPAVPAVAGTSTPPETSPANATPAGDSTEASPEQPAEGQAPQTAPAAGEESAVETPSTANTASSATANAASSEPQALKKEETIEPKATGKAPRQVDETVQSEGQDIDAPVEDEAADQDDNKASLFIFADTWGGWQSAKSGTVDGGGGVYSGTGLAGEAESGFGLNWLGADVGYDGGEWGVTGSLRFGDGVFIYGTNGLGPVTQAYATWRPVENLAIDAGVFETIYGAEVAKSWQNLNYTRGELYFNMQPFWHTGVRAEYTMDEIVLRGMVVNDASAPNLGSGAINGGAQVGYDNNDTLGVYVGVLQSLRPATTNAAGGFIDTFIDVVANVSLGDLSIVGNFDMNVGYEDSAFWGASVAAGYELTPSFSVAVRGEYLYSPDSFLFAVAPDGNESLMTGTLSLNTKPIEGVDNFLIRWDNRVELASEQIFRNLDNTQDTDLWFSSTVGVVAFADLL